jgi:hypothetical protein
MADIYTNSLLIIAAADARDHTEGIFRKRKESSGRELVGEIVRADLTFASLIDKESFCIRKSGL